MNQFSYINDLIRIYLIENKDLKYEEIINEENVIEDMIKKYTNKNEKNIATEKQKKQYATFLDDRWKKFNTYKKRK